MKIWADLIGISQEDLQMAKKYIYCIYFTAYFFIELFYIMLLFLFWPYHGACEDFSFTISDPNPCVFCLNHWTTREVHTRCYYSYMSSSYQNLAPGASNGKESACNAGDPVSIFGLGRSPGEGIGYPL